MLGNERHRYQAIRFSCTSRRDSFRDKISRTKHRRKNQVCTTNKIWSFRDRFPWNKRNWSNNCISNIQDLCLAMSALWSGDTTIDMNPDQSPRRLSSKIYKVHAVPSSKNCSERCVLADRCIPYWGRNPSETTIIAVLPTAIYIRNISKFIPISIQLLTS